MRIDQVLVIFYWIVQIFGSNDLLILNNFFLATNGVDWINNTNWNTTSSFAPCDWFGVSCNQNKEVTHIHLNSNLLSGSILPSLGQLSQLIELTLSHNHLSG